MPDRRDFLRKGAIVAGMASISSLLPDAVQRAYAITADPGTSWHDAEHVVILMQENRSFDHMFGTLRGVRGFNDPRSVRQADGVSSFIQRNNAGTGYLPWRMNIRDSRITWMGSTDHTRHGQLDAWNGGHQNYWIEAKRPARKEYRDIPITMGFFTRDDLPFYYALADAFTVCDQNYCSALAGTTPNRLMLFTGTLRETHDTGPLFYLSNEWTHAGGLSWTTFPERLEDAGISWKFYQNALYSEGRFFRDPKDNWLGNYGSNSLERFPAYPVSSSSAYRKYVNDLTDRRLAIVRRRENILRKALAAAAPGTPEAVDLQRSLNAFSAQKRRLKERRKAMDVSLSDLTPEQRAMREKGLAINDADPDYLSMETISLEGDGKQETMAVPKGDVLFRFRKDVRSGKLPTVSWLAAPGNFSDHPSLPWYGAWYVSEVMNILTENPEVWKKTIFILTYDENDGYFDHAPCFVAADPKRPETGRASGGIDTAPEYSYKEDLLIQGSSVKAARDGPVGLGYRVPLVVASPWSRGGWVNSQISDHTSVIRFLETFIWKKYGKEVIETNISDWRRAVCGDLTSAFRNFDGAATRLPFLERDVVLGKIKGAENKPLPTGWRSLGESEIAAIGNRPNGLKQSLWQEPGTRPACAIPYELFVDSVLDPGKGSLRLMLRAGNAIFGTRSSGAPFNVYLYGTKDDGAAFKIEGVSSGMVMASYAVRAGDLIEEEIDLSRFVSGIYDIAVHGPNGFYRSFAGRAEGPQIGLAACYGLNPESIEFSISNQIKARCDVVIEDFSYGYPLRSIQLDALKSDKVKIDLSGSQGWYDLGVRLKGDSSFLWRYAGHVETGRHSQSDPVMGKPLSSVRI